MAIDHVSFGGWKNNLRLRNAHAELIIALDVGPRVISYRTTDSENVFKIFDDQLGGIGEPEWKSRGGHRFWLAPEDAVLSYIPDNSTVHHRVLSPFEVEVSTAPNERLPVRKSLTIALDPDSTRVTATHRAENCGATPVTLATWGLSVLAPGGIEIIPLAPLGEHPRDLLPNRKMILRPYTNMADPRWSWGEQFITLRQTDAPPTKLGLAHQERWIAYHRARSLFVKEIEFSAEAEYPDGGCNFETFTNSEMLEMEALGPLVALTPGAATQHTEHWQLFANVSPPPNSDAALPSWVASEVRLPA